LYVYSTTLPDRALRAAIAETDRLDPSWRLPELEARRAQVPDRGNSALQVLAVSRLLPAEFARSGEFTYQFENPDLPPEVQLDGKQLTALRGGLRKAAAALHEGRKLAGMPHGRYAVAYSPDYLGTDVRHADQARKVADLLWLDAILRAQDNDADGAVVSARAVLNAGRSLGDEPVDVSQLVRVACRTLAVRSLERTLAQGEPSSASLRDLESLLADEDRYPALLTTVRGCRAGYDQLMENLQSGKVSPADLAKALRDDKAEKALSLVIRPPGNLQVQRADLLHRMTQLAETAKLPVHAQQAPMKEWSEAFREAKTQAVLRPGPTRLVLLALLDPPAGKWVEVCQRSSALLRCAIAALAAERYRRDKGRWPQSLAVLVEARYLREVPADPYDGALLRFRGLADGVVIYALGRDLADDGGKLARKNPVDPGTDIGFRLWDVIRRRQPSPPGPEQQRPAR
jgi:hypothetical protein